MAMMTIDPPVTIAHLERIGFPSDLARKIVDVALGVHTERFTEAELAATARCLENRARAKARAGEGPMEPPPEPSSP